ncbi:hypothetical protein B0H13DRAFT_1863132 [Mycena leptocephala]|nr:hypothetical protein B0H13DRAFT_1863132 [Mycena leptocephala]
MQGAVGKLENNRQVRTVKPSTPKSNTRKTGPDPTPALAARISTLVGAADDAGAVPTPYASHRLFVGNIAFDATEADIGPPSRRSPSSRALDLLVYVTFTAPDGADQLFDCLVHVIHRSTHLNTHRPHGQPRARPPRLWPSSFFTRIEVALLPTNNKWPTHPTNRAPPPHQLRYILYSTMGYTTAYEILHFYERRPGERNATQRNMQLSECEYTDTELERKKKEKGISSSAP